MCMHPIGILFALYELGLLGEIVGSCEICGNSGNTKLCYYAGTKLQICPNCMNKMGVSAVPNYLQNSPPKNKKSSSKSGYSRKISSSNNVMRQSEDLIQGFSKIITEARNKNGFTKEQLAAKISEKVSVIKRIEQGIRPNDKVIKKIEKCLKIKLMQKHSHIGHSRINSGSDKGFTMGDFFGKQR